MTPWLTLTLLAFALRRLPAKYVRAKRDEDKRSILAFRLQIGGVIGLAFLGVGSAALERLGHPLSGVSFKATVALMFVCLALFVSGQFVESYRDRPRVPWAMREIFK